jgi:immunity protein 53 of polymorphic toxin system
MGSPFGYHADRPDVWTWLQAWYVSQCDGDWEHQNGVSISTLDNPGWQVDIDLADLDLDAAGYSRRETHRSEDDWCITWTEGDAFRAACGPTNLGEALHAFRVWVSDS